MIIVITYVHFKTLITHRSFFINLLININFILNEFRIAGRRQPREIPVAYLIKRQGWMINLPGADLNAACGGPDGAISLDGASNKANAPAA
ncbi:hypothetical protein ABRZ24_03695 [Brenneria populi]|uniref:Uncharacterized protein n=1 Tax=Brenneria populi TaxID=1505588 RepID=A0ABU6JM21_9GAMM|nr:hypothetical protein [Brenneria populi Li et al. 2015]